MIGPPRRMSQWLVLARLPGNTLKAAEGDREPDRSSNQNRLYDRCGRVNEN
jgi:hypothetical protein